MKKALADLAILGATADIMSGGAYGSMVSKFFRKQGTQKNYKNKNNNIEYYYDENGNFRRRRK